ncbi:MAG: outer membrane protein assembly factor BamE [Georgfuchsia sp.]
MRRFFLLPLVLLTACGELPKLHTPSLALGDYFSSYHLDIRQGNFVTQEMASQLKPGQTREQVRFILGTPLLTDPFHGNRWDYVYRYDSGKGEVQQRNLSVYFQDDKLLRVDGDVVAANPELTKSGDADVAHAPGNETAKPAVEPAQTSASQ